jgi:hypothetical protein
MFQSMGNILQRKTAPGLARSIDAAVVVSKATECGKGRWTATVFRNSALTIIAPSGIAAQELVFRKIGILAEINAALGVDKVKRLIIRS